MVKNEKFALILETEHFLNSISFWNLKGGGQGDIHVGVGWDNKTKMTMPLID